MEQIYTYTSKIYSSSNYIKYSNSRWSAWRKGVRSNTSFVRQDLWRHETRQYDNVVIFGVEQMMSELETKLEKELEPGSLVVACRFKFPTWTPDQEIGAGVDTVWTYRR